MPEDQRSLLARRKRGHGKLGARRWRNSVPPRREPSRHEPGESLAVGTDDRALRVLPVESFSSHETRLGILGRIDPHNGIRHIRIHE